MKRKHLRSALIIAAVAPLTGTVASAQTDYFWFQPSGGSGAWDISTANWAPTSGAPANTYTWTNSGSERANFSSGLGTITLDAGGITAYGVNSTVSGTNIYTFAGPGALTLAGTGGVINNNGTVTFAAAIAGNVGLTETGSGNLVLATANTYTGSTSITGGSVTALAQASGQVFSSGPMTLSMGSVRVDGIGSSTTTNVGNFTVVGASSTVTGAST